MGGAGQMNLSSSFTGVHALNTAASVHLRDAMAEIKNEAGEVVTKDMSYRVLNTRQKPSHQALAYHDSQSIYTGGAR